MLKGPVFGRGFFVLDNSDNRVWSYAKKSFPADREPIMITTNASLAFPPTSPDEDALRQAAHEWFEATKKNDVETVLGLMTDDAIFHVTGQKPFSKETFAKMMKDMMNISVEGTAAVQEIHVTGDWAYVRTYLEIKTVHAKSRVVMNRRAGYALSVWRKEQDGQWRLTRDANLLAETPH